MKKLTEEQAEELFNELVHIGDLGLEIKDIMKRMKYNLAAYPAFFNKIYQMGYEDGTADNKKDKEKKLSSQN